MFQTLKEINSRPKNISVSNESSNKEKNNIQETFLPEKIMKAMRQYEDGQQFEAENTLQHYLKENPKDPESFIKIANLFQLKGNDNKAEEYYKLTLKRKENNLEMESCDLYF